MTFGIFSGNVNIATTSETVSGPGFIRIFNAISGSLTVSEMGNDFFVFFAEGVSQTGLVTFGDFLGSVNGSFDIGGSAPGVGQVAGTIRFRSGIPDGLTVNIWAELTSTYFIHLHYSCFA